MDYRGHLKRSHCIPYIITGSMFRKWNYFIRESLIFKFIIPTEESFFDSHIIPRVKSIRKLEIIPQKTIDVEFKLLRFRIRSRFSLKPSWSLVFPLTPLFLLPTLSALLSIRDRIMPVWHFGINDTFLYTSESISNVKYMFRDARMCGNLTMFRFDELNSNCLLQDNDNWFVWIMSNQRDPWWWTGWCITWSVSNFHKTVWT